MGENVNGQPTNRCKNPKCGKELAGPVAFCAKCGHAQQISESKDVAKSGPEHSSAANKIDTPLEPKPSADTDKPARTSRGSKELTPWKWITAAGIILVSYHFYSKNNEESALEHRVDAAIALSKACKMTEVRAELTGLEKAKANKNQLDRVERSLIDAVTTCGEQDQKKNLNVLVEAVDKDLAEDAYDKATGRVAMVIQEQGPSKETDELNDKIESARGNYLLGQTQKCIRAVDRDCTRRNLAQLEGMRRPELTTRIQQARQELAALVDSPKEAPRVSAAPSVSIAAPTPTKSQDMTRGLLVEGESLLRAQRYREAMHSANTVLRLDPENRAANDLLERAKKSEQDLLQKTVIN